MSQQPIYILGLGGKSVKLVEQQNNQRKKRGKNMLSCIKTLMDEKPMGTELVVKRMLPSTSLGWFRPFFSKLDCDNNLIWYGVNDLGQQTCYFDLPEWSTVNLVEEKKATVKMWKFKFPIPDGGYAVSEFYYNKQEEDEWVKLEETEIKVKIND